MEIDFTTALGLTAGGISTLAFVPLWLVYGLVISDVPVIAANTVLLLLVSVILVLKIGYEWR